MRRNSLEALADEAGSVLHAHISDGGRTCAGIRLLVKTLLLGIPAQLCKGLLALWAGLIAMGKGMFWAIVLLFALILSPLVYVKLTKEALRVKNAPEHDECD